MLLKEIIFSLRSYPMRWGGGGGGGGGKNENVRVAFPESVPIHRNVACNLTPTWQKKNKKKRKRSFLQEGDIKL